jgi:hypothetical protein
MSRAQQAIRDLSLVAAALVVAIVVVAVSVGTSIDHRVTDAASRVGDPVVAVRAGQ